MMASPLVAVGTLAAVAATRPAALPLAAPILALWAAAPWIAFALSRPMPSRRAALDAGRSRVLRAIARKTWAYFDTFVTADDHFLPPDNIQIGPGGDDRPPHLADQHRPRPAGHARGPRLRVHRHRRARSPDRRDADDGRRARAIRGPLLNWYDTRTLAPLPPAYVSTVDSGNLAGALLTPVASGAAPDSRCRAAAPRPRATALFDAMNFRFLFDPQASAVRDRLSTRRRRGTRPARRVVLRSAGVRGAARQLHRHRQGRRAGDALVPPRPLDHERARRAGAALVERHAVRVPDAAAGDAHAIPNTLLDESCRLVVRRQMDYAAALRRALGHLGVGLQPGRSARQLSVQGVRRARARAEARARRRAGRRAVRDGARGHDRSRRRARPTCAGSRRLASAETMASSMPSTTPIAAPKVSMPKPK